MWKEIAMVITSKDNETIKKLKKLKEKKYRDQENCYIIEGVKLIREAIQENAKIKLIIICDDCKQENDLESEIKYEIAKYECISVNEKICMIFTNFHYGLVLSSILPITSWLTPREGALVALRENIYWFFICGKQLCGAHRP